MEDKKNVEWKKRLRQKNIKISLIGSNIWVYNTKEGKFPFFVIVAESLFQEWKSKQGRKNFLPTQRYPIQLFSFIWKRRVQTEIFL